MRKNAPLQIIISAASLMLAACAQMPSTGTTATVEEIPELTLNLPENDGNCVEQKNFDFTPLERGFSALAAGKHIEAVQHFQRYQRLEKDPAADLEAGIAIAYVSILPASPYYDTQAARRSYRKLRKQPIDRLQLHEQTLLMRQSLDTFLLMERKNVELSDTNDKLESDLEKRESALRRLRELALGRKAR